MVKRRRGEDGYNLVILIVLITVLNVMVAVALPLWSYTIRREKEEEAIFRGLQYAEAIRVFRQRFGRYPVKLEELMEVEPRSIRQLWSEPLTEEGEFGLVVEGPPPAPAGPDGRDPPPPTGREVRLPTEQASRNVYSGFGIAGKGSRVRTNLIKLPRSGAEDEEVETAGPVAIHGVYLDLEGETLRTFFGRSRYEEWVFVAELFLPPITAPDRPLPRVRDDWLGKPFAVGLDPNEPRDAGGDGQLPQGTGPGAGASQELAGPGGVRERPPAVPAYEGVPEEEADDRWGADEESPDAMLEEEAPQDEEPPLEDQPEDSDSQADPGLEDGR